MIAIMAGYAARAMAQSTACQAGSDDREMADRQPIGAMIIIMMVSLTADLW
jgi:hypothetical protein